MFSQVQPYLATFQKYLLSANKKEFINSLKTQSKQRKILDLLTQPFSNEEIVKEKLRQLGISDHLSNDILAYKIFRGLSNPSSQKEEQQILAQIFKKIPANFQYMHPKPIDITNPLQEVQQHKIPSQTTFQQDVKQLLLKRFKETPSNFNTFSDYGVKSLDQGFLKELPVLQMDNFLTQRSSILCSYDEKFIAQYLKDYYDQKRIQNKSYKLPGNIYRCLTIKQIDELMKSLPYLLNDSQFISFWFKQRYQERLDRVSKNNLLSITQKQQKRKLLTQIRDSLKKIGTVCVQSLQRHTFMELLILDLAIQNPQKELFLQFLQNMHMPSSNLTVKYNNKVMDRYKKNADTGTQWNNVHNYELVNWDQDKIIQEYLTSLFKKEEDYQGFIKQFSQYLSQDMLQKNCARVRLNKGETIENIHTILSNNEVNQIKEKKKISILTKNKKHFAVDEDVILTIRVKNVKIIKIKIYQLNLQKNYLEKETKIDENMNLTFLEPTMSFIYEVDNQNPFKQNIYDLPIKQIQKKPAIYIVDLRGDGISSRAVIRKGAIVCLSKTTLAGKQLKFFDDDGKRINQLSLWIRGKKEQVKQSYTIPFGKNTEQVKIIAVKNNFAELISVTVENQNYSWNIGYIYNSQSFIVGNKAKIIIHPRLKLYNEVIGLKLLKNSKISVQIINSQNIKSYLNFQNIKWSNTEDYILEFPIQSYVKTITVNVSAEIDLYSGTKKQLTNSKQIAINLSESTNNFIGTYLKKSEDGEYQINILGINGQPIPHTDATVTVSLLGTSSDISKQLRSNAQGVMKLGKLSIATGVMINGSSKYGSFNNSWRLNDKASEVNYSSTICYKKGQKISLPIACGTLPQNIQKDFVIEKKNENNIIFSCITNLAVINNGRLQLQDLPEGQYQINYLPINRKIRILVLQGKQWEATNQVYDSLNGIVYQIKRSANQLVSFGKFDSKQVEGQNKINIKLGLNLPESGLSEYLRAHVLLSNYAIPNCQGLFDTFQFVENKQTTTQIFRLRQSEYFNNKTLSDEGCYVQNRQDQKKFIGNNLQKPHIFLKRIQVRNTNQKDEELDQQGTYLAAQNSRKQRKAPAVTGGAYASRPHLVQNYLESHNNFLMLPSISLNNLKGQTLQFNIPKGYNNLNVILISQQSAIQKDFALNIQDKAIKDLRHLGLKDQNQKTGWTMSRQSYPLRTQQTMKISRDSHWATVSLSNIAAFAQIKGQKVPQWAVNWNRYSPEKKLQSYGKNFCHELNAYIKYNDRQFFNQVVKPYISNKIKRTFVDLCLIDSEQCINYSKVENIQKLNQFQKILLIRYLVDNQQTQRAKDIAKSMQLLQKINKISFDVYKQHFDTVIDAKKASDSNGFMDQLRKRIHNRGRALQSNNAYQINDGMNQCFEQQMCLQQDMLMDLNNNNNYSYTPHIQMNQMNQMSNRSYVPQMQIPQMQMQLNQMNQVSYAMDNFGGIRSAPPPPPQMSFNAMDQRLPMRRNNQKSIARQNIMIQKKGGAKMMEMQQIMDDQFAFEKRGKYKAGFDEVQKTKQYTQTTYQGLKNSENTKNLVQPNLFWAQLAKHIIQKPNQPFLSESFMYLKNKRQFTLALCFIPNNVNSDFDIKNQGQNLLITAKSSFLVFVKQVRPTEYSKKFGIMINQRFFDPNDQYIYEQDGTAIEKQVQEFIVRKVYTLQTVVTNTSGTNLQLQILLDIPEGAIPLQSHEYTQILNQTVNAYSTCSFSRFFYFPKQGKYNIYPSNACRGKQIIAKALPEQPIQVKTFVTTRKLQSFNDVIHSGSQQDILEFLAKKNIFDYNTFHVQSILWMLRDKKVYQKVIQIFRKRCYFNMEIWGYAMYHKDIKTIKQIALNTKQGLGQVMTQPPIFEYFPYYSSRTHKFANQSKSTIRNVQLKQTYGKFLFYSVFRNQNPAPSSQKISFVYYLLLQDRIQQASNCFNSMNQDDKKAHQLQSDYLECFLDMYQGYPNFTKARKISEQYIKYPIESWQKLFKQVYDILKQYDEASNYAQEEVKTQYKTQVFNQGSNLKISIPPETKIQVYFFPINLELYFSEFPFSQFKDFSAIKPYKSATFASQKITRDVKVERQQDQKAKDTIVEIYESKAGKPAKKVYSTQWTNPQLKIKITEKKGNAQVFYKGKQLAGCYCKVYSKGDNGQKFYRDGYTDITGTFKYVLGDFEKIKQFKILFVTEHGGVTMTANPPQKDGLIQA